jgi:mono/diheme cytochrome c family protein
MMRALTAWYARRGKAMRGLIIAVAAGAAIALAVFAWVVTGPGPLDFAGGKTVALADYPGPDPTGVPAPLAHLDIVRRGEYLTIAADCVACHTAPGGKAFAGGTAIPLPFGTLYTTNITPDRDTGIGDYSDAQFLAALRHGIRRDGAPLYPAMPYASYTYISDADGLAIKAYLFSLAPVHAPMPANTLTFPFNQRWAMYVWSALFNADRRFRPDVTRSAEWNRGAYLAEALTHCGECHTPRNLAFALDNRAKFAGAVTAGWQAYNITPETSSGIGAWSDDALAAYISSGHADGHGTAAGPMGEAIDASFHSLAPSDVRAIVAYLRTVPPRSSNLPAVLHRPAPASPKEQSPPDNGLGKSLFAGACAGCHGWTGESPVTQFATLTGARTPNDPAATNVAQAIILGVHRTTPTGITSMPSFGGIYSDTEVAALANYVTARFGTQGARMTAKDVAQLRGLSLR